MVVYERISMHTQRGNHCPFLGLDPSKVTKIRFDMFYFEILLRDAIFFLRAQNRINSCDLLRAELADISPPNNTKREGKDSMIFSLFGQFKYSILLSPLRGVISRFETISTPYSRPNGSRVHSPHNHRHLLAPPFLLGPAPLLHEKIWYPQSQSREPRLRPQMNAPATAP